MNTKKEKLKAQLKEYRYLKEEEKQIQEEIQELNETLLSSPVLDNMPKNGQLSDATSQYATKLAGLHTVLLVKRHHILTSLGEIENMINSLSCPVERLLMRARYIEGKDWEKVGHTIHYGWSRTHDIHSAILEKLAAVLPSVLND